MTPDHWVTQLNLGKALEALARYGEAVEAYTRAMSLNPRAPSPLRRRAEGSDG
jgi:cytochrome c-type biogenesis protein CcmH/NrfG